MTGYGTMTLDTWWWQLYPEVQEELGKQMGQGIFRETWGQWCRGCMMGYPQGEGLWLFRWDHSETEVAAEETCEHQKAGSLLHPPQGLYELRGLVKETVDPQLGSEITGNNACTDY